jgi:hypothetical protein
MADRLKVTELDFDTIKTNLKNFLKQQSEFQDYDFEGSGLSVLMDILAYNTHYNAYYINMIANESFLDTALLRNSVVSHAKKLGYVPRSTSAPRAIVNVTIDSGSPTSGSLTLPKGYSFLSNDIDGVSYNFVTLENYTKSKIGNTWIFNSIPIYEGQFNTYSYSYSQIDNPKQIFTIPDYSIDTKTLKVLVQQSSTNTNISIYNMADGVLGSKGTDEVYFIQEGLNSQYQIYFGDNVFGKALPDGAVVTLEYLSTTGTASNSANNFIGSASVSGYSAIIVDSLVAAAGGTPRETVDEIKFAAPLQSLSQNRAVTKNDYIKLIQQRYPYFDAVNVWGGEENKPPVYGKVFISAKPKLGFEVTDTVKDYLKNEILKPISILTVSPEIVDVDYNYLKVVCELFYEPTNTTQTTYDFESSIRQLLLNFADLNLNKFNTYFNYSGMERAVQDYSTAIISNEIELYVGKKFRPDLINPNTYVLDWGFELDKGASSSTFESTPDFTMLDGDGVQRQCFFEEVPSSYTGIESISVTNGGFGYTSTPTIEIIGDGVGASAYATIVNGKVSKITVTSPGINYTTASIRILGGGGSIAAASAVLEGRYGYIRTSYYKIDEVTNEHTKIVLNSNSGTIDYFLGTLVIPAFNPLAVNNDFGDIMIMMKPKSNIIQSKLNKMLVLDETDPTSVVVKPTIVSQ